MLGRVVVLGQLAALGTAACWAVTSIVFAESARRIGSLRTNLLRLPVALVLLSLALVAGAGTFAGLDRPRIGWLAASAVVGLVAGDLAFFAALERLGPRLAALMMSLAPPFATLAGALLLGEIPGPVAGAGMVLTLGGVAWVVSERHGREERISRHRLGGVAIAVFSAACQGLGLVLSKLGMAGEVAPLAATWVRIAVATAAIWALAALVRRVDPADLRAAVRRGWQFVVAGAFFGPFVGVWLSLAAVRLTDVGVAATLMSTTPLLLIPVVALTERYRPTLRAVAGTILAIAGVALLFSR
jgi:drug/metabolite transporter (DMT)-like permease